MKKLLLYLLCGIASPLYAQNEVTFNTTDDSFIRGGNFEKDNYGSTDRFRIKQEDNVEYARMSFIKFDLRTLNVDFKNASLQLTTVSQGSTWDGNFIFLQKCSNNNWNESSINYTNAPILDEEKLTVISTVGKNEFDISSLVQKALTQDSILTIAITKLKGGADDWCDFASKEHSSIEKRPLLTINKNIITSNNLIYPTKNQIDWSLAGHQGNIPNYKNIVDVTTLGIKNDGTTDNSSTLEQIIQNSVPGTVLSFPSGEYFFSKTINLKDSIILRGNCPSTTLFKFDLNKEAQASIWFKGSAKNNFTKILANGLKKDALKITVENSADFKVGGFVEIIQDNDSTKMYTKTIWDVSWAANALGQVSQIVAINGNEITLKTPLLYDFTTELNVRVQPVTVIQGAGIENLKVNRVDDGNDYSLRFAFAYNCWIRNIESDFADRGHVEISKSTNIEVRDSYFHHSHNYGGGGHGYGVNFQDHATLCLIENNIFHYLRHTFLAKEGSIGNVFAYNYSINPNGSANDIALHGHYGLMNLIEGNIVQKIIAGDYWGPSGPGNTYFRNRVETSDIVMDDYTHSQNIIANEITNGTVDISSEITGTWQHHNFNKNGLIDKEYFVQIPASLYHKTQPEFLQAYNWPVIDPQNNFGKGSLPAKDRWDTQKQVTCLNFDLITQSISSNKTSLQVYPNPSSSIITISFPEKIMGEIKLFNTIGENVLSQNINGNKTQITISNLENGIYIGVINHYHFKFEVKK